MSQLIGQILEKYKIEEEVGKGGMAVVYRAQQMNLGRSVALKILYPHLSSQDQFRRRFDLEAKAAASLRHPNIVTIYDYGKVGEHYFIAMEWIKGAILQHLIAEHPDLPLNIIVQILIQVCEGLDYAHRHNIFHRDIKPSNLMIDQEGIVKIVDFGIARVLDTNHMLTAERIIGTPNFISPEQINGAVYDGRSEIYALGVLGYFFVTRQFPFQDEKVIQLFRKIEKGEYASPKELNKKIPLALSQLIERCLSRRPEDRFESVASLKTQFQNFVQQYNLDASLPEMTRFLKNPSLYKKDYRINFVKRNYRKGLAHKDAGEMKEARIYFEWILEEDPQHAESLEQLKILAMTTDGTGVTTLKTQNLPLLAHPRRHRMMQISTGIVILGTALFIFLSRNSKKAKDFPVAVVIDTPAPNNSMTSLVEPRQTPTQNFHQNSVVSRKKTTPSKQKPVQKPSAVNHQGYLYIHANPYAQIFLKDSLLGEAPTIKPLALPAGDYRFVLKNPYCRDFTLAVKITRAETLYQDARLLILPAYVQIEGPADCQIYVDGRYVGVTPLDKQLVLDCGWHNFEARFKTLTPWHKKVDLLPREVNLIRIENREWR